MGATVKVLRETSQGWQFGGVAFTNANGQWKFVGLEPATYKILVSKPSFIAEQRNEFRREWEKEIVLDKGGRHSSLDVRLTKGGVIAGRVVDEQEMPVPKMEVSAARQRENVVDTDKDGQSWTFTTDDQGNYRIFGLLPGKYLVGAGIRRYSRTNYHAPASLHGNNYDDKQLIEIAASAVVTGVEIKLCLQCPALTVEGKVRSRLGRPVKGRIGLENSLMGIAYSQVLKLEGRFEFNGLGMGAYKLRVLPEHPLMVETTKEIELSQQNKTGIEIILDEVPFISLRIEAGTSTSHLNSVSIRLVPAQSEGKALEFVMEESPSEGWVLPLPRMSGSGYWWEIRGLPDGYYVNGITVNDEDRLLDVIEFEDTPQPSQVIIHLESSPATIEGKLETSSPKKFGHHLVCALPTDEKRLDSGLFHRCYRPDSESAFKFTSLAPGEYFLLGVELSPQEIADKKWFLGIWKRVANANRIKPLRSIVVSPGPRRLNLQARGSVILTIKPKENVNDN